MRPFTIAAIMIALLTASAFAQQPRTSRTDDQKKADTETDQAYQNTLKATGGDKPKTAPVQDPWGVVRPSSASKDKR